MTLQLEKENLLRVALFRYHNHNLKKMKTKDQKQNHGHIDKMIHGVLHHAQSQNITKVQYTHARTSYAVGTVLVYRDHY